MATRLTLSHVERVALYVKIIQDRLPGSLTDFAVARMRNAAPSIAELEALNDALKQMGWER